MGSPLMLRPERATPRPGGDDDMELVVTVVSHDRPGLIADVTGVLADLGGNLESSSMTLLQGHFAWTLVVDIGCDVETLRGELLATCPTGVTVSEFSDEDEPTTMVSDRIVVNLHGADRKGIVAAVARVLADAGGNIVELSTHLHEGMYLGTAEVEFSQRVDLVSLASDLDEVATRMGVSVTAHREDADLL
jgi:glycine cleavage system transcriptional repressor